MKETIAVAMSGGVDSSTAAALLVEQEHKVIGLTARMWPAGSRCCSDDDIESARQVAVHLGFAHHVVDLHESFQRQVVDPFVAEYARGRTPSPCALCNRYIKFGALMDSARELGAARIATGHYARITQDAGGIRHLLTGVDTAKDQSYFLFDLSQEQLAAALFPLGTMRKSEVVAYARERGVPVTKRPESQDLCFAEPGRHYAVVELLKPDVRIEGDILDMKGRKLGRHEGLHRYTIGQRRGLGIAAGKPMYVVRIDAASNTVVVGDESDVMQKQAAVAGVRWISGVEPASAIKCGTRIRYNHDAAVSVVMPRGPDSASIQFDEPQFAVTPGQVAAFYVGDELIGGGWIE